MVSISYEGGKHVLFYRVESMQDEYDELEKRWQSLYIEHKEKARLYELMKRDYTKLHEERACLLAYLRQKKTILQDFGVFLPVFEDRNLNSDGNNWISNHANSLKVDEGTEVNNFCLSSNNIKASLELPIQCKKSSVITLLHELEGSQLKEKILNLLKSRDEHKYTLNQLKQQLQAEREKTTQLTQNIGNQLHIDLPRSDDPNEQVLDQVKIHFGNNKAFDLRFQLKKSTTELQLVKKKMLRLEKRLITYKEEEQQRDQALDKLKFDKKKLVREIRDANTRILELMAENQRNQILIVKFKESQLSEVRANAVTEKTESE